MNDNLESWLDSLGLSDSSENNNLPEVQHNNTDEPAPQSLTENDFDDILNDLGFQTIEDAVIEENSEDVGNESETPSVSDLDAEEDADWEGATVVDVPVIHEQIVEEVQEEQQEQESAEPQEDTHIPLNSPTLLMDQSTSRFSGTEWFQTVKDQTVIVAGIGGIGSWLAFQLARLHPYKLMLYDDDIVEVANMSGQLYSNNDVGRFKCEAIQHTLDLFSSYDSVYAVREKFTTNSEAGDIMMCGFDNMAARKTFFDAWHSRMLRYRTTEERARCLYLDGRLSIDTLQIFCITGDNEYACDEYYNKHLFSDAEADEAICSMKQTTYMAALIGSLMTNMFVNFVAGLQNPVIPYDLPFFTEYDAHNIIFKTEK